MQSSPTPVHVIFALMTLCLLAGCGSDGPELGYVEGTVKLDGQPLEGAVVTFTPRQSGRPSVGQTNSDGWYELAYSNDRSGALPGEHAVAISTFQDGDPGQDLEPVVERVPAKYNRKSELATTVEVDDNVIDFDLDSEGEIAAPSEEGY